MAGPGAVVALLILAVFAAAVVFAPGGRGRLRAGMWMLGSTLGFVAYNYVLALSYGFIFKEAEAAALACITGTFYTYYIGWFLMAVALLAWAVQNSRWRLTANAGGAGLCLPDAGAGEYDGAAPVQRAGLCRRHLCRPARGRGTGRGGEGRRGTRRTASLL